MNRAKKLRELIMETCKNVIETIARMANKVINNIVMAIASGTNIRIASSFDG